MGEERNFRTGRVAKFLKKLRHTSYFPIQQLSVVGDADYILCCHGRFVWLELKAEGKETRVVQEEKAAWVRRTHGVAIRARPENWEKVKELLLAIDRGDRDVENKVQ